MSELILDTGPLVAFLNKTDGYHAWARKQLSQTQSPWLTSEIVLAETCFLLRKLKGSAILVMNLLREEVVTVPFPLKEQADRIQSLMQIYENVPMSLADAALVCLSEAFPKASVLSLDHDFFIYRRFGNQSIPAVLPMDSDKI